MKRKEREYRMSRYSVNEEELRKGQQLLLHVGKKLEAAARNVENAKESLMGYTGYGIERQRYTLETQKNVLVLQMENMERLRTCIQQVMERTQAANQEAKAELQNSELNTGFKTAADIIAAAQAKKELEEKRRREEEERKKAEQEAAANRNPGNAGGSRVDPNQVKADMESRYQILRQKRGSSFRGMCGAFTYQQLAYENVVADGDGITYGEDYYRVWMQRGRTRTGYFVEGHPGSNGLRDLIQAHNNEPLANVVVSFDRGPYYPYEGGHVLLIHRIENGMVYYMDNNDSEGIAQQVSVDEFMGRYPNANGAIFFYK